MRLEDWRWKYRWTQEDLANRLGVTAAAVGNWERGYRRPSWDMLHRIKDVVGADSIADIELPPRPVKKEVERRAI